MKCYGSLHDYCHYLDFEGFLCIILVIIEILKGSLHYYCHYFCIIVLLYYKGDGLGEEPVGSADSGKRSATGRA